MRLKDFQPDFKKIATVATQLAEDFSSSLENEQIKRILNSALDFVRPYHLAIGFRLRKLTSRKVEVVVPARPHNLKRAGEFEEGVLISVAHQMAQALIARWDLPVEFNLDQVQFFKWKSSGIELCGRFHWEDLSRESLRAELIQEHVAHQEWVISFVERDESRVADVHLGLKFKLHHSLSGKGFDGNHS